MEDNTLRDQLVKLQKESIEAQQREIDRIHYTLDSTIDRYFEEHDFFDNLRIRVIELAKQGKKYELFKIPSGKNLRGGDKNLELIYDSLVQTFIRKVTDWANSPEVQLRIIYPTLHTPGKYQIQWM